MSQSTSAPQVTTGTTRHAVVPLLRPVDVPTEKLTVVRPTPPVQRLTARPAPWPTDADVDHALGAYGPDGGAA